jgi:hypothetical protein
MPNKKKAKKPDPSSNPTAVNEPSGTVQGKLVDENGAPIANTQVSLFGESVRSEAHLADGKTGADGTYAIAYARPSALNLLARAYDANGKVVAQSATVFAAAAQVVIDLTTAPSGIVRPLSTVTNLTSVVTAQLQGVALGDLKENKDTHEIQFLANSLESSFEDVAYLYLANVLGTKNRIQEATFLGIFYHGIPPALDAALLALPDAGIDDAFTTQVLTGVLSHSRAALSEALTDAVAANILPASYAATQDSELNLLDALRVQNTASTPYLRGKTSLSDVLSAGSVADAAKTAFVQAYADNGGKLGPTWKTLRANKNLTAADFAALNTTLSLGELLTGNLPLIKDSLSRLSQKTLACVLDLALLDENDWVQRITAVDPNATSIPQVLPNDTAQQRIARFAKALASRFAGRYPSTAFAGYLSKAPSSSFAKTKTELINFLVANPKFQIKQTNIDQFVSQNKIAISAPALTDMKLAQRLFRLSPHAAAVDALKSAGHNSAQSVYFMGRAPFLAQMTEPLGSASLAKMAYARAQMTYATALTTFARYNQAFNGANVAALAPTNASSTALQGMPDLQALFGSLDYFQCEDCQSVYSPAAYLVDLLQYLKGFAASGTGVTSALDALLLRRPDIQYVALDCNNTNITLPYIDLVNELFEAAIAPPAPPITVIDTAGTSEERRALPQQISQAAYALTANAVFPLTLPFDLAFSQTSAYIAALGTTRAAVLALFAGNPVAAASAPAIAGASLGLNPEMQKVVNGSDPHQAWDRWGFAQHPPSVIDPKTGAPYSPNPGDWVAALSKVPVLLNHTGLSLQQLYQLLEVVWVTQSGVTLSLGTETLAGVQILSADTDGMTFTGLSGDVLDRANRFLRLWSATNLKMWELDWALKAAVGGVLNDDFLYFLAGAIAVQSLLKLPFQEVLSFWLPLETRDVTNHLGNEDTVVASTYSEVFRSAAVLASAGNIFVPLGQTDVTGATNASPIVITTAEPHGYQSGMQVSISGVAGNTAANGTFTITVIDSTSFSLNGSTGNGAWTSGGSVIGILSGNQILAANPAPPTPEQTAITAALGLSAADISAILTFTGAANTLSLDTLNWLLQYQRLSSALSLEVAELTLWIQLTAGKPFQGKPDDTLEFYRRFTVLRGTGLAAVDLDYLLRDQSVSASSLTFTPAQSTAVLQTICDAIAKLPAPRTSSITGASNTPTITITTTSPMGLQTGTQVTISGVVGNSAANGTFTITAVSATSFTLNGPSGNGPWTSGGVVTVTAYDAYTIQTIFVTALAAATGTTANVVAPVLENAGVLPLSPATIQLLATQGASVDPSLFPALVNAFISIAKAAALFNALRPADDEFAFAIENAGTFAWLNPGALVLVPVTASPYSQFESLLRAFKLNRRQSARTPKLFDLLSQWLPPNTLPADLPTAIGGRMIAVTGSTNTTPIVVTTASPHGLQTGEQVTISGVLGNTAANGVFTVTVTSASQVTLDGSAGNGVWTSGGTVTVPGLAAALNGSVNDVLAIATALGATPPNLAPGNLAGSLADAAMLAALANALDVVARYGMSGASLVQLAAVPPTTATATAAMGVLQSQYSQSAWLAAIQPVEDALRQSRRDALVAYLLGPGPAASTSLLLTTDDIFDYFLIDPEMSPCAVSTRLLQAALAIQQFVQQCFLNLTFGDVKVDTTDSRWSEWSWRQQFRLWQANREVFLYPENYLLPELRKDASPFFTDLENDLRQTNCDADAAEAAIENYLRKLVGVARLQIAAHYNETKPDGSTVLHVFARARGTPPQWFYRTRNGLVAGSGAWSAWLPLNLDIAAQHLIPVIWDQHLHLVWPIFKQVAEQQSDQAIPVAASDGSMPAQQAPPKFWTVEFAMSEFSAGQWQAKQTLPQKMFLATEDPPASFTFRSWQDASFNLNIQIYKSHNPALFIFFPTDAPYLVASAILPMPEAPLRVQELASFLPPSPAIDPAQEPTFVYVTSASMTGQLAVPGMYGFSAQDIVYGGYTGNSSGTIRDLNVLYATTNTGQPVSDTLLSTIEDPRIVVPAQELVFDSADPFFVADPRRTYLVQPEYFTISSSPVELTNTAYIKQWATKYTFETFYHPYARTFLRELEIGGVSQLMTRNLQLNAQAVRGFTPNFDFKSIYNPTSLVETPYPGTAGAADPGETNLDFSIGSAGAYSLYNWEVFYHIPMFMASLLMQNQQFQDAMTWLEFIFNPADSSTEPAPQRFWQTAPLNAMNAADWTNQQIQNILDLLAADTQQGINDLATANAIANWLNDPFDPHAIASLRISAYGKATVMKFLDDVIAWGDWYYNQYTAENVSQAEQLYILADLILGPQPQVVRPPNANQSGAALPTYASLKNIDLFSNALVSVENLVVAPEPPQSIVQGTNGTSQLPQFPGVANTLLFCIPPNDQLLEYWQTVSQRLYNIRHCLNLQGIAQPLPLYGPPLNPLQLIEAAAAGAAFTGMAQPAPIYRFSVYLQKAVELTNDVRSYGSLILSALEKQDAETLSVLRANQELDIQTQMLAVKNLQVTEAQEQITALQNQKAVVQIRYNFYSTIAFMNAWETAALTLQGSALIANGLALILDSTSGGAHLVPTATVGVSGFGGTPTVVVAFGGENVASSASSFASVARGLAGILSESSGMAATLGGYERRMDEWQLQAQLAAAELTQMDSQIAAAADRLSIANTELSIQNAQIANAQAVSDFLTNKYTNAQLYNWMLSQLTTVYTQAYQLAYSLALQSQNAYQYELGNFDTFIQFGYWDSQHKGLSAGDSLLFDLRRMEAQYLAENSRELELTKHISLALTSPLALVMLRETGTCQISLDEALFEADHPGQYFRRLRGFALTFACVTGPYTGVNASLSLINAMVRIQAPGSTYTPQAANAAPNDPTVITSPMAASGTQTIATSTGQNDSGLFEVNLRDERWLPFEGQGAISTWNLVLDPRDNNFDFSTITDVVLHVRYTARGGGDQAAANNVRAALKPTTPRSILVSARNTFSDSYYSFFNPADSTATQQTLTLPLTDNVFPFSNLGSGGVEIQTIAVYLALSVAAAGNTMAASLGPTGGSSTPLTLAPSTAQTTAGDPVAALTATATLSPALTTPQSLALSIPSASLPAALSTTVNGQVRLDPSKIEDVLLVITYLIH